MSADLVAFLNSALDEDEAAEHRKRKWSPDTFTKRCPRCHMPVDEIQGTFHSPGATLLPCRDELTREEWETFIDAQPAPDEFRLAVIASTRAILEAHPISGTLSSYAQSYGGQPFGCETCHEFDGIICGEGYCDTLRALVGPYRDRAGFDPSWLD